MTLQVMAERPDGTMSVGDCEKVSRAIAPILDIEDPIERAYHLEISSPGIDRPLVRKSDFENWAGHVAKLETRQMINGRKRYKGMIISVSGDEITFRREAPTPDEETEFVLPIGEIKDAKLVLSDDLVNEGVETGQELRDANGPDAEEPHVEDTGADSTNKTKH